MVHTMTHTHLYRGPDNWTTIRLACPWDAGSDMIPPPTITFKVSGERTPTVFTYVMTEED